MEPTNSTQVSKKPFNWFAILIWLLVTGSLMVLEPLLIKYFPPECVYWFCFGWSTLVILILNFALLVTILALVIPMFAWKVVRGIIIVIVAVILLLPFNSFMFFPSQAIHKAQVESKVNSYEIRILQPSPNVIFEAGKSREVTWESKNIPSDAIIGINLVHTDGGVMIYDDNDLGFNNRFPNTGKATITMPTHFSHLFYKHYSESSTSSDISHALVLSFLTPGEIVRTIKTSIPVKISDPVALEMNQRLKKDMIALKNKVMTAKYDQLCKDKRINTLIDVNPGIHDLVVAVSYDKHFKENDMSRLGKNDGIVCASDGDNFAISATTNVDSQSPSGYCFDSTQKASDSLIEGRVSYTTGKCVADR